MNLSSFAMGMHVSDLTPLMISFLEIRAIWQVFFQGPTGATASPNDCLALY